MTALHSSGQQRSRVVGRSGLLRGQHDRATDRQHTGQVEQPGDLVEREGADDSGRHREQREQSVLRAVALLGDAGAISGTAAAADPDG